MKRGFTLVELLAVIVILSVIAIITVPIIGNVIEESKKKALEQSAYGLVEAANYYAIKYEGEHGFEFEDGKQISSKKLDYKGSIEGSGKLYIDNNGDISLCINTDKYYVIKNYNSGIEIKEKQEYGCNIEQDALTNKYVAYLDNGKNGPISVYTKSESDERYALKTDLNNYVTNEALQDAFDLKLGTETLTTTSQTITGAINEVNSNASKYVLAWKNDGSITSVGVEGWDFDDIGLSDYQDYDALYIVFSASDSDEELKPLYDNVAITVPLNGNRHWYTPYRIINAKNISYRLLQIYEPEKRFGLNGETTWVISNNGTISSSTTTTHMIPYEIYKIKY